MAVVAGVQPGQGCLDVLLAYRVVGQQGAGCFVTANQGAYRGIGGLQDGFWRTQPSKQQLAGDGADAWRMHQPQPGGQGFVVGGGDLGDVRQGAHRGMGKGGRSRRYCQSPRASASAGWMMPENGTAAPVYRRRPLMKAQIPGSAIANDSGLFIAVGFHAVGYQSISLLCR